MGKTKKTRKRRESLFELRKRSTAECRAELYLSALPFVVHDSGGGLPQALYIPDASERRTGFEIRDWPMAWFRIAAEVIRSGKALSIPVHEFCAAQAASYLIRGMELWNKPDAEGRCKLALCAHDIDGERLVVYGTPDDVLGGDEEE